MKYIMAIDDSATIRTSIAFVLKETGLPIEQAENGSDALKKIQDIRQSGGDVLLYITDVNMPVMDGLSFVKELRKSDKFTPVLMLTTESENSMIKAGKEAGASGWITKPFKADQLLNTVKKLIR
ncbi:MAG: response regulator [Spirochaetes bacterium]|nr:response regulator [Spirochaetota bacterium]